MKEKVIKNTLLVLLLIIFGKLLSFARDILISSYFGASEQTDAYFAANVIPSLIYISFLSSITTLIVPQISFVEHKFGRKALDAFISKIVTIFFLLAVILSGVSYFNMQFLVNFIAPGFTTDKKQLAIELGKILVLSFPITALTQIFASVSNAKGNFYSLQLIPLISALFVIAGLYFFHLYGIKVLAYSSLIAFLAQIIIQIFLVKKYFNFHFSRKLLDENVKKLIILAFPVFIGFSIDQINLASNTIISSTLGQGSISLVNYAQRLESVLNGTFILAIITVIYPILSNLFQKGYKNQFEAIVVNTIKILILILLPLCIFLAVNSIDIVKLVFDRGLLSNVQLEKIADLFSFYAMNVFFISLRELMLRIFYINNNTKYPLYLSAFSLMLNVVISYLLKNKLDILSFGVANIISTFFVLFFLARFSFQNYSISIASIRFFILKNLLIVSFFVVLLIALNSLFSFQNLLLLITFKFLISNFFLACLIYIFDKKEFQKIIKLFKKRLKIN